MDRFVSHVINRLDAKGRVSIPASFRAVLARDGFDGLYVYPTLSFPALDCGGNALIREIDGLLSRFPRYSDDHDQLSTALLGASQILKIDPEGRFVVTDMIREVAGITDTVAFVGQGHKFQLWEPEAFREHFRRSRETLGQLRARLASMPPRPHEDSQG